MISRTAVWLYMGTVLVAISGTISASTLQIETKKAYASHVEDVERELSQRAEGKIEFSRLSEFPANIARMRAGQTVIENLNQDSDTPKGIIHDWIGGTIIEGVPMKDVIKLLTDYNRHQEIFAEVIDSKILEQSNNSLEVFLRFKKEEILTVVVDTYHQVEIKKISPGKVQILSRSTKIQEIKNFGEKDEIALPEGEDRGFLWRMNTYWTLEEKDEGILVECRNISLTRDIPFIFAFIVKPLVGKIPRETLASLLRALKENLEKQA